VNDDEVVELRVRIVFTALALLTMAVVVPLVIYREARLEDAGLDFIVWMLMGGAGGVIGGNISYGVRLALKRRRRP